VFDNRFPPVRLLVTNTKVEHNTKELVAGVSRLLKGNKEVVGGILTAIDGISLDYVNALKELQQNYTVDNEAKFVQKAITHFPINHHMLCALGVSHPSIDSVIRLTSEFNLPSKITGAGGGGCVISIITAGTLHYCSSKC
jgi:mevalonate kinase